jgi:hypothetical protein
MDSPRTAMSSPKASGEGPGDELRSSVLHGGALRVPDGRLSPQRWYVWNNNGDKADLRNADFVLRDTCEWTSVGSGYKWC